MNKDAKRYVTRCAINGDVIDTFDSIEEAKAAIAGYYVKTSKMDMKRTNKMPRRSTRYMTLSKKKSYEQQT